MHRVLLALGVGCGLLAGTSFASADDDDRDRGRREIAGVQIGTDANSGNNPLVQPGDCEVQADGSLACADPALAGNGRDQSLQFGDVLRGSREGDLQIGLLGSDVLLGGGGDDVQLGGIEHFTPGNRDRAFGGRGADIFIWKPGDGSDFFDGGPGRDALVFGLTGENGPGGEPVFEVVNDGQAGDPFIDPETLLPRVDVTNSPGFCQVVDPASGSEAGQDLDALGLDRVVRFLIRGVADAFDAGAQENDNGLRVSLHLVDVEFVVCTSRAGGEVEVLDLRQSPARVIGLEQVRPRRLRERLEAIVQ